MGVIVIPSRGISMEKAKAPKHCCFSWFYNKTLADCVRVDAKWDPGGIRQDESGREQGQPGKSSICNCS